MPPMGHAKHPLGGKGKLSPRPLGIIPKGLEAVPSPHEGGTSDPWSPGLRPLEAAPSTLEAQGFANPMQYFGEHGDTKTRRNNKTLLPLHQC